MAYSKDKYLLTHLLQDAWYRLGQMKRWKVTGGSLTTAVNTAWGGVDEPIFEDDDPSLIYGTAVVIEDAGGLGAAPEGEMGRITDYDSGSFTVTIDAVSTSIGNADRVGLASPLFPLEDMVELANLALQRLGEIDVPDTSLSYAANTTEYTLPTAIRRRPLRVRRQTVQSSGNNQWEMVQGWDVIPASPGSNWTLVLPDLSANYGIEVLYRGLHPKLTAFDSPIVETIHPELALSALLAEAYQWYNNQVGGSNQYFLQRENKALQDLEAAKVEYQIESFPGQVQGMVHWGRRGRYVPLTSDLRA